MIQLVDHRARMMYRHFGCLKIKALLVHTFADHFRSAVDGLTLVGECYVQTLEVACHAHFLDFISIFVSLVKAALFNFERELPIREAPD